MIRKKTPPEDLRPRDVD